MRKVDVNFFGPYVDVGPLKEKLYKKFPDIAFKILHVSDHSGRYYFVRNSFHIMATISDDEVELKYYTMESLEGDNLNINGGIATCDIDNVSLAISQLIEKYYPIVDLS